MIYAENVLVCMALMILVICMLCSVAAAGTAVEIHPDIGGNCGDADRLLDSNSSTYIEYECDYRNGNEDRMIFYFHSEKQIWPTEIDFFPYPKAKKNPKYNPAGVELVGIDPQGNETVLVSMENPISESNPQWARGTINADKGFQYFRLTLKQTKNRSNRICLSGIRLYGNEMALEYQDANGNTRSTYDYHELTNTRCGFTDAFYMAGKSMTLDWAGFDALTSMTLVLRNGVTVTIPKGIGIDTDSTLTITCEPGGTGRLVVSGGLDAVIGGSPQYRQGGSVTINGGVIDVTFGENQSGIGWYSSHVTINRGTVTVNGTAAIGNRVKKLDYPAIVGSSVTINGGTVTANGRYGAGIGGSVTINGGHVTATSVNGAGLGGDYLTGSGSVTIRGGVVNAHSTAGAGIGSGAFNASAGRVSIEGGTITASSDEGAGIGGGYDSSAGYISITSGNVTATGGRSVNSKIGATKPDGMNNSSTIGGYAAPGIGSGAPQVISQGRTYFVSRVNGGDIHITGGTVNAIPGNTNSDYGAQAIGTNVSVEKNYPGSSGSLEIGDGMTVAAGGEQAFSNERVDFARRSATAVIQRCTLPHEEGNICAHCGMAPINVYFDNPCPDLFDLPPSTYTYVDRPVTVEYTTDPLVEITGFEIVDECNMPVQMTLFNTGTEEEYVFPNLEEQLEQNLLREKGLEDVPPNRFDILPRLKTLELRLKPNYRAIPPEYFDLHHVEIVTQGPGTATTGFEQSGNVFFWNSEITLYYKPENKCEVQEVRVVDGKGKEIPLICFGISMVNNQNEFTLLDVNPGQNVPGNRFKMPTDNVTVYVTFVQNVSSGESGGEEGFTVSLSASPVAGGTLEGAGTYTDQTVVTVSAEAAEDYQFSNWTAGGVVVSESPNLTFQVCGNCELTANFIPPHSIITLTDGPGTLTSSTPATGAGKTVTLDPTPDEGCEFLIWVVDGEDVVIDENNTFVMPDCGVRITARFGICSYWIAADRNIGGVLFDQNKEWGSEVTVTATEEEGYVFLHWVDEDGTIVSVNPQYTFTVRKACTLTAVYTPCYTISFGAGVRGAANGEGPDCAFTVTLGDTTFNDTFGNLTFTDGVAQVTLKNGGTVTVPDMPADVTATVEAIPPEGYVFSGWSGDSGDEERRSSEPVYNFSEYSSGILMTASFEKLYTVTVTDNGHGTAAASVAAACEGTEVTLNEKANEGYTFKEWQVISGGVVVHRAWLIFANGNSFWENSFTLPAADVEIRAVFEKPYAIDTEYCMAWTEDDNGQQLAANWAMPGDTLVLMRDATGQIPSNLYFPNDSEAQFRTQGGVTLSWNADRYVWQFVMPESDVGITLVMLERGQICVAVRHAGE